jgi:TolB-like protein/Tfp pilus assembly protein PilF
MSMDARTERTIPGPVIVLPVLVFAAAVISIAAYWLFSKAHSAPGPPPSIAVLPFEGDRLGDGVAAQIIRELSPVPGFETIARQSSFLLRGQRDTHEIAHKLNVRNVLFGGVERDGEHVRVSARLIRADDGVPLWQKIYERDTNEIFTIEDEISNALVDALGLKSVVPLDHARATGIEAYQLYLQGAFEQAVQKDPKYAPAYAAQADADLRAGSAEKARAEAEKALNLDPRLAAAHIVLGRVKSFNDLDWNGARTEFERALAIDSADPEALRGMAMTVLAPEGRIKDAIGQMNRVVDLDPLNPAAATDLGVLLYLNGEFDASIAELKKAGSPEAQEMLRGMQTGSGAAIWAAQSDAKKGEKAAALDQLERAYQQRDPLLPYLKTLPGIDAIRSEPRYQALLAKMHLQK